MIYSKLNRPETIATEPGKRTLNIYQQELNKNGHKTLIKVGETNIYEKIQSHAEEVKIENILHALAMGDMQALQKRDATYMDTTSMPKNLMELENLTIKVKDEFYQMPLEVRKEFSNSVDEYISKMGTQEFFDVMSKYNEKIANIEKEGSLKAYNEKVAAQAKFENDVAAAKGGNEE